MSDTQDLRTQSKAGLKAKERDKKCLKGNES